MMTTEKTLLSEALSASRCVISVMGDHAGEGVATIFRRKIADIQQAELTFWLVKSPKAKPPSVQHLCGDHPTHVLFVAPASAGGARPTEADEKAVEYSVDGLRWRALPAGLGPVTGNLDSRAYALVFDALEIVEDGTADLWHYADFAEPEEPIKMILGCSTVCATKKDMTSHPGKLKSRVRRILAVARTVAPHCVFVR
jgi:hypothetical protein